MKPVGIGILGVGQVVRAFHLPALAGNVRARVVALGNHRAETLQSVADDFQVAKTYTDLNRMADDPEIDAILIALPNALHSPLAVRMLEAGKHVFCEKPMAISVRQACQMASAAASAQRTLLIGQVWRHSPEVQWLRDVVRSGVLGTIYKVRAHAVVAGRGPKPDSWFVRPELAGGGALADVGIHSLDTISFLFDDHPEPVSVSARIGNSFQSLDVEDTASVWIEYDNGMAAEIEAGWYCPHASEPHGAVQLFGTLGYARILPAWQRFRTRDGWKELVPQLSCDHPDDDPAIYCTQMEHFLDTILMGARPACDARQGLRNMILLEAAYRSAAERTSVSPEPRSSVLSRKSSRGAWA
ncbi:MAG TPA: Gfo/Idh/MocA family oxidoreductase [Pirellulales bacterium]|nr:Gfo/Idh/MocA family oxidoreductase [Pirellulales bacterium]